MKAIANIVIVMAMVALPGGIFLAFYMDNSVWLIMSAVAFIFFYAG